MSEHGVPEPVNSAGVTSTDPDQSGITQDHDTVVVGDVDQLPEGEPVTALGMVNDIVTMSLPTLDPGDGTSGGAESVEYHDLDRDDH